MFRRSIGCVAICALSSCSLLFDSEDPAALPADASAVVPPDAAPAIDGSIPSMPFPPTSDVNLVDGVVGDVNGDGIDDLLLATAPSGGADNGVYILLGPQTGPSLVFHHFVTTSVAPTSIAFGKGALGMDTGASTLLVGGRETNASVEAYVYDPATPGYGAALIETTTSGSDPSALVVGDFDSNGVAGDVMMATIRGLHKFYQWLPDGTPPEATAETLTEDVMDLGKLSAALDDELVIVLKRPRIMWRFYHVDTGTRLGDLRTFDGACGILERARVAQDIDPSDEFMDVVATSSNRLCGYRLQSAPDGTREIREFHYGFDTLLPAPADGFDDIVTVNLNSVPEPEIVLLDTFNTLPSKVTLVRDADDEVVGFPGVLGAASISSRDLSVPLTPAFLLAPDFDNDGTSEIWAIDLRARDVACLKVDESELVSCL